jgi:hypothetical protein
MFPMNTIVKKSDRFISQLFDLLSSKNEAFWKCTELPGTKTIRLLAFIMFSCDFDLFAD